MEIYAKANRENSFNRNFEIKETWKLWGAIDVGHENTKRKLQYY